MKRLLPLGMLAAVLFIVQPARAQQSNNKKDTISKPNMEMMQDSAMMHNMMKRMMQDSTMMRSMMARMMRNPGMRQMMMHMMMKNIQSNGMSGMQGMMNSGIPGMRRNMMNICMKMMQGNMMNKSGMMDNDGMKSNNRAHEKHNN
jgi:hypothetical protein